MEDGDKKRNGGMVTRKYGERERTEENVKDKGVGIMSYVSSLFTYSFI
jgi:hypothetical protein